MSSSRQRRAVRGVVAASVATFVALLSHLLGGGEVPRSLGVAIPWVLSLPVCVLLTGRLLSLWRLSVSVMVSQVLFHALFVLGTPSTGAAMMTSHTGHAGHGVEMVMPAASGPAHTAAMHADPIMWAWHGIAAAVTIAIVYRGEKALLRLHELAAQMVAWARRRLASTCITVTPASSVRRLVSLCWSTSSLSDSAEMSPLRRRGPPLLHAL